MRQPPHPYIIDIEASGFGPHSYPIEVGLALEPEERFSTLITPERYWAHWSEQAESVHGISRQTLLDHGHPVRQVAARINRRLKGCTVYSDGWVVDKPWLITLFAAAGMAPQFAISALEMILSEAQMEIWHRVKADITRELAVTRHRASHDALIVQQTYLRTRAMTVSSTPRSA
ncbi:hypothetical protein [Motiliproteus sediminis]|uniref:3'-5' exonuclease n=1 Tax=Motiliproteus sediminis TaxID=1468178 RepID=UPI001AEF97A6|nr:hypothetical protein [Motiliproteus sediminis]